MSAAAQDLAARLSPAGLPAGWKEVVAAFFATPAGKALRSYLLERAEAGAVIYPPDPYRALRLTAAEDARVVILGQDPYHGPGQATGLAFSVSETLAKLPPSLKNIYKEVAREYDSPVRTSGDLSDWARQGVLLLNSSLTVEEGQPLSHAGRGWEALTDAVLLHVLAQGQPLVFMLWGGWAQKKEALIKENAAGDVLILKANHPSPLSALRPPTPFAGCGHFRAANDWLAGCGRTIIDWVGEPDKKAADEKPGAPAKQQARSRAKTRAKSAGNPRQGRLF